MIEVVDLYKSFGRHKVLKGLSLKLDQPGITAVLGPNASGKTTLIKTMLGMVIPDSGDIRFDGESVLGQWEYRDRIDYLPQIARFPDNLRVRELFDMITALRNRESRAEELISHFGIQSALGQKLGHLSGGTRQKVNIVAAFMYDNPVIFLDEPSAGLDPVSLQLAKELILQEKAKGKLITITTHIMGLVEELADEIVFILEGVIHFRGTKEELRSRYGQPDVERSIAQLLIQDQKNAS